MESFVNEALKDALSVESPDETIRIILEYLGKVLNGERTWFNAGNSQVNSIFIISFLFSII